MTDRGKTLGGLFARAGRAEPSGESPAGPSDASARSGGLADVALRLNIRALAAEAATRRLNDNPAAPLLRTIGLRSHPPRWADIASGWFAYWARELRLQVQPRRKLWEWSRVLQAFHEAGVLRPGARVLGFGVGDEPLASYFASLGLTVVASDLPGATDATRIHHPGIVDRLTFERLVEVSEIDIRRLDDATLRGFDACWSCGVLNALPAPHVAEDAMIGALDVLRPGGLAVHATDLAFAPGQGVSSAGALVFDGAFFSALASALAGRGHEVLPPSFSLGDDALDRYIDDPALDDAETEAALDVLWRDLPAPRLKEVYAQTLATSFAVICRRRA